MLRSLCRIALAGCVLGSEVCNDEEEITSALQVSHLQDRSMKRSMASGNKVANMELALASKGDSLESSTSGKGDKSIAQLEKEIASAEARLASARATLSTQTSALKQEIQGVVDETKALTGEIAQIATQGKQIVKDATLAAYNKAEVAVAKAEARLQSLYDDVLIKYASKLQSVAKQAQDKVSTEIDELKDKMNGFYGKVQTLQDEVKDRLNDLTTFFSSVKDDLANYYDSTLKPKFDSTKAAFDTAVDDARTKLSDVATSAKETAAEAAAASAELAEKALVAALVPVVIAGEQLERLGEMTEEWRVKTAEKLYSFKKSAQRQAIKAKEALENAVGTVQEQAAQFLETGVAKFESAKDKLQTEFDRQVTKSKEILDDIKAKLDAGVQKMQTAFVKAVDYAKDLKDNAKAWAKDKYDQASIYKQQLQDQLRETATEIEELVVKQTEAAKQIAQKSYDNLKYQLSRAKSSAAAAIKATQTELQRKVDEAKVVYDQAKLQAQYALDNAKTVIDDFAKAAVAAGKDLAEETKQLIDEAVGIVVGLVEDPDDWATGTGIDGKCEEAKRYRFDTNSDIKKYSFITSKEACQEKCKEYTGCAFWVRYQLSRDCHLFDSTAVVKIDRSWSNTPYGGPVDCVIE